MSAAAHVLKRNAGTATDQEDFVGRVRIHSSPNPKLTLQLCPRQPSGPVATAASVLATTVTTPAWPRMTSQCAQRPTPRPQARPPRRSPLSRSRAWTATCKVCDGHSLWGKVGQRRVAPRFCCSLYEAYTATVPRVVEKPALRVQTNRFRRLESLKMISIKKTKHLSPTHMLSNQGRVWDHGRRGPALHAPLRAPHLRRLALP